ncbi:MAG TPA: O-antigen ligase family protein [Anaerolineales bacterium]|nr:O-antigen ligase family protein [Anaerolineales bacterium]
MRPLNFAPAAARVGLVLAVAYLLWGGGAYYGLVSFSLNVLSVGLMAVGLTAWFAWRIRRGRGFARTPLDGAILLGLGAAAVSAVFSLDPGRSAAGVWLGAVWAGVYWVTVDGIAEGLSRRLMGRAIYLSTLVVVCLALGQVIAFWRDWLALGLLPQVSFRVSAPNPTATGLNFLWPLLLAEMVETRRLWLKSLMGLALAGAGVAMLYTSSRGGWLGMAAGGAIFAAFKGRMAWAFARRVLAHPVGRLAAAVGTAAAAAVVVFGMRLVEHASHGATLADARGYYWDTAWKVFLRSPVTGQGLFTFASAFLPVWQVPPSVIYNQAHGVIHNLLAETGLLGLGAAVFMLAQFGRAIPFRHLMRGEAGDELWQMASLASLGANLVHSLFETPYVSPAAMVLAAWMAAMVMPVSGRGRRHGLLMIPVVGLGVWSVWAYQPLHRGIELGNQGQWPAARIQLDEAVRRDPLSTFAKLQAAYVAQRMGDPARAVSLYQIALRREPGYSINWANLAAAQWAMGDQAAALESLAHARSLAPETEVYRRTEAAWLGKPEPAAPLSEADLLDVRIAQLMGKRLEAAALQADRERLSTGFAARRLTAAQIVQLAEIEAARGDFAPAEYLLQYAAATREADPVALQFLRGDLAAARDDLAAAVQWYAMAWEAYPASVEHSPGTNYGWLLFIRESLRPNLAPGLAIPTYPPALVERLKTLVAWQRTLGQLEAAQAVEDSLAERGP